VTGDLSVLGIVREATLTVAVTLGGDELRATARHVLKQKDQASIRCPWLAW
jgi:hypothetical protein